jgi:hypothetical protein
MHEKELLSFIRNPRTYWLYLLSFLIPFALFFLLFRFSGQLVRQQMEDGSKRRYKVAWVAEGSNAKVLKDKLDLHLQIELQEGYEELDLMEAIQNDSLDAALVIAEDFDTALVNKKQAQITIHYKSSGGGARIVENLINDYKNELSTKNLAELELSKELLEPIYLSERNYFSMSEMMDGIFETLQRSIGSLLALVLLIFGSISARYALRISFWRELETGQLALIGKTAIPKQAVFRTKILWAGIFAWENMLLALFGFCFAIGIDQEGAMQNLMIQIRELLPWSKIGLFALMGLPFAFLLVSFYSFTGIWLKAWRTITNNFSFLILLFGFLMIGALPAMGLWSSFIPFFSQAFIAVDLIQEQYTSLQLMLTAFFSILFTIALIVISFMRFNAEGFLLNRK